MRRQGAQQNQRAIQQPLIQEENEEQYYIDRPSPFTRFREYFLKDVQTSKRKITLDGTVQPTNYQNNLVKNTKYTLFTFLPLVLFHQFKFFYNLFFLINALTQLIQVLRVGLFITYIGPLAMVLTLTMLKQAYDDINTYKRDIKANSKKYQVIRSNGFEEVKSKDLKVGDVVRVEGGDRVPADMLTLYSDGDQGTLFLKTDQLDGETDWKLRKSVKIIQSGIRTTKDVIKLLETDVSFIVDPPNAEIYTFSGLFIGRDGIKEKLTLENTMWTTTVLTSGVVYGLVIYVGRETRISMGGSTARTKFGILDMQINNLSKILFVILVFLTTAFILLQNTEIKYVPIQFMRMLILLSSVIPISMRVNLDYAKLFYAYLINKDKNIKGAVTRNSNCPQELGRVQYILSDKTGTLTKNDMLLRQISINQYAKFSNQQNDEIIQIMKRYDSIRADRNARENYLKNIVTALALCHNVTPIFNQERTSKEFQAASPDEVAFVKMAQLYGLSIQEKTSTTITIKLPNGALNEYDIKYTFPFTSETKRMGILLQNKQNQDYIFYLKGADAIMKEFITVNHNKAFIQEECMELSKNGLRTLVFGSKVLTKEFYTQWSSRYEKAYNRVESSQIAIEKLINELEMGVDFLGITGIEDKLQDELKPTIESLRGAGIKIWMITGDKMETAECIGRSCGLQRSTQANYKIEQANNIDKFNFHWSKIKQNLNYILIIDGKTLTFVLADQQRSKDFFQTSLKLPAIICCRCSPSQKKVLTAGVKANTPSKSSVLGIGDGGNDVGMIQAADVGIGIVGKEGMQAALAADFSIKQFKDLKILLFWHGRLSYVRSSLLANFIIHRGFIISVIQLIFSCIFYYVSIPIFNSYLQLGYATIFTFWPVFALILDKDIDIKSAKKYPKLYQSLQKAEFLSFSNFFVWIWKATYQAGVIIMFTLIMFLEESYIQFETVSFTVLMITQYFMTVTEITKLHFYLLFCVIGSLLCYIGCLLFLNAELHIAQLTFQDALKILLIFAASWGPLFCLKLLRKKYYPTDAEIIMKTTKQNFIARDIHGQSSVSSTKQEQNLAAREIHDQQSISSDKRNQDVLI